LLPFTVTTSILRHSAITVGDSRDWREVVGGQSRGGGEEPGSQVPQQSNGTADRRGGVVGRHVALLLTLLLIDAGRLLPLLAQTERTLSTP
jgi:hypothetical protein